MEAGERTRELFERVGTYPELPLVPLPDLSDFRCWERIGMRSTTVSRFLLRGAFALTGFRTFQRELPSRLEVLLRTCNLRGPVLFAPAVSATLALEDDPRGVDALTRAATLILAARQLRKEVFTGTLEPDKHRGQVLEMGQYPNLFSTCLIIDGKRPRVFKSSRFSQITVVAARRFFTLDLGDPEVGPPIDCLIGALADIARKARHHRLPPTTPSPALFTSVPDRMQRRIFRRLQRQRIHRESLETLRHSLFTLCLDLDSHPASHAEAALTAHSRNLENRWQHSSLQIVVFGNARACIICNFSTYIDGNVMMRSAAELQRRAARCPLPGENRASGEALAPARELTWRINSKAVLRAYRELRPFLDNQQATFEITAIGRDYLSSHNLDAVATFVLALQLASKEFIGRIAPITQFLTMSKYRFFDLVTTVVTTQEVARFVEYVEEGHGRADRARDLLHEAIQSQIRVCREARRHLPVEEVLSLFLLSQSGKTQIFRGTVFRATFTLLGLLGLLRLPRPEIVISHPKIYREVPVVGRPGIRLPNVKYFGLHYQILEDRIVITMMPSIHWKVPNAEFIEVLEEKLKTIRSIVESQSPSPAPADGFDVAPSVGAGGPA